MTLIEKFEALPLDKKIALKAELNSLSPQGIRLINQIAQSSGFRLPENFDWSSDSAKGRVSRRISKHAFQEYGVQLSPNKLAEIGNIYNEHYLSEATYHVDFTRNLYWQRGEFGDDRSCFWTDKLPSRLQLERSGGMAFRFYDESGKGYGRAWVLSNANSILVFNAYGNGLTIRKVGMILADYLGEKKFGEMRTTSPQGFWFNNELSFVIGDAYNATSVMRVSFPNVGKVGYCDICGHLTDELSGVKPVRGITLYQFRCSSHL